MRSTAYLKMGLFVLIMLVSVTGWSQAKTITGTVISGVDATPMSGVSVTLKGLPGGTQTMLMVNIPSRLPKETCWYFPIRVSYYRK